MTFTTVYQAVMTSYNYIMIFLILLNRTGSLNMNAALKDCSNIGEETNPVDILLDSAREGKFTNYQIYTLLCVHFYQQGDIISAMKSAILSFKHTRYHPHALIAYVCLANTSSLTSLTLRAMIYSEKAIASSYIGVIYYPQSNHTLFFPNLTNNIQTKYTLPLTSINSSSTSRWRYFTPDVYSYIITLMDGNYNILTITNLVCTKFGLFFCSHLFGAEYLFRLLETIYSDYSLLPPSPITICNDIYYTYFSEPIQLDWPPHVPIKIYISPLLSPLRNFIDISEGLSNALDLLNIPNKIVTKITRNDNSLYIIIFFFSEMTHFIPKYYIIWNFEKNPLLSSHTNKYMFERDASKKVFAVLPEATVRHAIAVWETAPSQLHLWDDLYLRSNIERKKTYFVPPLFPFRFIEQTCEAMSVPGSLPVDTLMPIDVLFYGHEFDSDHRFKIRQQFEALARQHHLRVEFFLNDPLFGNHRDTVISQAKIVLNLGTAPAKAASSGSYSNSSSNSSPTHANSINAHRIRHALALGKVVVSEATGIPEEDAMFAGVIVFAATDSLAAVCLSLLGDPELRGRLERRAVEFMAHEQYSLASAEGVGEGGTKGQAPSALQHLVLAIRYLRGTVYPPSSPSSASSASTSTSASTEAVCSHSTTSLNDRHSPSPLDWARDVHPFPLMIAAETWQFATPKPSVDTLIRSSDPTFNFKINRMVLIGYLARRYRYRGTYLEIGCTAFNNLQYAPHTFTKQMCVDPYTDYSSHRLTSDDFFASVAAAEEPFDLVLVDGLHEAEQARKDVLRAMKLLSSDGIILLHDCRPQYEHEALVPEPQLQTNWLGDVWRSVLWLRGQHDVDIAICDFDWGVGVVKKRKNPLRLLRTDISYEEYSGHIDRFVPLLSLRELDEWLSDDQATRRHLEALESSDYYDFAL